MKKVLKVAINGLIFTRYHAIIKSVKSNSSYLWDNMEKKGNDNHGIIQLSQSIHEAPEDRSTVNQRYRCLSWDERSSRKNLQR